MPKMAETEHKKSRANPLAKSAAFTIFNAHIYASRSPAYTFREQCEKDRVLPLLPL